MVYTRLCVTVACARINWRKFQALWPVEREYIVNFFFVLVTCHKSGQISLKAILHVKMKRLNKALFHRTQFFFMFTFFSLLFSEVVIGHYEEGDTKTKVVNIISNDRQILLIF